MTSAACGPTASTPSNGRRKRQSTASVCPRLAQLFSLARDARSPGGQPVRFNIETKITPSSGTEVPDPVSFAAAVVAAIKGAKMIERVTVQSFDWRTLVEISEDCT